MAPYIREFDYSSRHCYEGRDGVYYLNGGIDEICSDWKQHVDKAGHTEFLRWIREFGVLAPGIVTGFEDGWLKLGEDTPKYREDFRMYCENYGDKLKCFLSPLQGFAYVELYDESLLAAAMEAERLVGEQYTEMER